jgi:hypothetical protein
MHRKRGPELSVGRQRCLDGINTQDYAEVSVDDGVPLPAVSRGR